MATYPVHFKVESNAGPGMDQSWQTSTAETQSTLGIAIPHEFDGPGGQWSPEGLFAAALGNCFIATFKVMAKMSKLEYQGIRAEIEITVEPDATRQLWVSKAHLKAWVKGANPADRAQTLMEKASKSCLILNSVKTEKTSEFHLE